MSDLRRHGRSRGWRGGRLAAPSPTGKLNRASVIYFGPRFGWNRIRREGRSHIQSEGRRAPRHVFAATIELVDRKSEKRFAARIQDLGLFRCFVETATIFRDGIHLPGAETHGRHGQRQVAEAMRPATDVMQSQITLREAFERARQSDFQAWPVIDEGGVVGVVSLARIEEAMAKEPRN